MKEKKVTIYDIAAQTGVSIGTVNRALNGKERISPKTKQLVLETAERLGYTANVAAQGLRRAPITIGAILFCPIDEYVDDIIEGIEATAKNLEKYRVSVDIRKIPYTTSAECLAQTEVLLQSFAQEQYNGILLFMSSMLNELQGISELIRELKDKNIHVATVANDFAQDDRAVHVGVDAHMAGCMAAEMLEMSCAGGQVAVLIASEDSPVNRDYIRGFEEYAARGVFSKVVIYEHFDDHNTVQQVVHRMLQEHPDLDGVYLATASSVIACEYIKQYAAHNMTVITTDLLQQTPDLLRQKIANAVIFQNPYKQGKNVLRLLYHHIIRQPDDTVQHIAPQVLLSSNLDAYLHEDEN